MSTHALVGVMHGDKFKAIYVHSDGYLDYVGQLLLDHYDSAKANWLVAMGDCSILGKTIGHKISFNDQIGSDERGFAMQCRFYMRDRDEKGCEFAVYQSFDEVAAEDFEHVYLMKDNVWYYSKGRMLMRLEDALNAVV